MQGSWGKCWLILKHNLVEPSSLGEKWWGLFTLLNFIPVVFYFRLLATDWTLPSTTWALCFVSGDCWLLTEQGQVLWKLCFVKESVGYWLNKAKYCLSCVLFKEIIGYQLNKTKYYLSFVFRFRDHRIRPSTAHSLCFVSDHWLTLSFVFCVKSSLATDWIRPSTTWALCFLSGDCCCCVLTEQGQIPPELCVLLQEIVDYWLNMAKYCLSCVFCYRRSLLLATDWTRPSTTRALWFVFWRSLMLATNPTVLPE